MSVHYTEEYGNTAFLMLGQTFNEEGGKYRTLMAAANSVIPITSEPELGFGDPDKSRQ
jgi:hypothetical protein